MTTRDVVLDAARSAGVEISDDEADSIVWNETGFPAFWNIPQDGATPEECFRKQVADAIRRRRRRENPSAKRRRIAVRLAEVRMRTVAWRLAGTGWTPGGGEQPLWVTP